MARSTSNEGKPHHLKDLARRWGVSRATLYRWRRRGSIPKGDIGPHRRIYSERLVERIESARDFEPHKVSANATIRYGENRTGMSAVRETITI